MRDWDTKLARLEGDLSAKVGKEDFSKKIKKAKKKLRDESDESLKKL